MKIIRRMRDMSPVFITKGFWLVWVSLIVLCLVVYAAVKV